MGTTRKLQAVLISGQSNPVDVVITGGSITIDPTEFAYSNSIYFDYSGTPVNTTTWQQLFASLADEVVELHIFDSSGQTMEIGIGAPASEARRFLICPGGPSGPVRLTLAAGSRVSIRGVSGTANVGALVMTLLKVA